MMALMYDSGCRVQELADLKVGYISFQNNPTIKIVGKGNKARLVPLIDAQIDILKQYMKEHNLLTPEKNDHPLFLTVTEASLLDRIYHICCLIMPIEPRDYTQN